MKPSAWISLIAIVAFIVIVVYSSFANVQHTCEVCIEFNGRTDCRTAAAPTQEEAVRAAQNTACGLLAAGMDQTIGCGRAIPQSAMCTID